MKFFLDKANKEEIKNTKNSKQKVQCFITALHTKTEVCSLFHRGVEKNRDKGKKDWVEEKESITKKNKWEKKTKHDLQIGRAHVWTTVTFRNHVWRLQHENKDQTSHN